jgi:hypothetical protein
MKPEAIVVMEAYLCEMWIVWRCVGRIQFSNESISVEVISLSEEWYQHKKEIYSTNELEDNI